ncbi:hypothetical protein Tco_1282166 [Tanacetum coccineum]
MLGQMGKKISLTDSTRQDLLVLLGLQSEICLQDHADEDSGCIKPITSNKAVSLQIMRLQCSFDGFGRDSK